jgi:hypothetical protein
MIEGDFRCKLCDKIFVSQEALEMHKKTKHFSSDLQFKQKNSKINYKRFKNWAILIIVAAILVFSGVYLFNSDSQNVPVTEINIISHSNAVLHIYSNLEILINEEKFLIPANIGISQGVMRPIHTHDSSGEIHIEGPYARDFTLGEFFQIWGKNFNSSCIFEYCTQNGKAGELKMFVNGQENLKFENYVMRDGDKIIIKYNSLNLTSNSTSV